MQSGFLETVCQMGVFMICAQAIVHFRPKAAYEKYLKLLVSAMMLIQMLLLVDGVFVPEGEEGLAERAEWFANSLQEKLHQAAEKSFFSEEDLQFQITGCDPLEDWTYETQAGQITGESKEEISTVPDITIQISPVEPVRVE